MRASWLKDGIESCCEYRHLPVFLLPQSHKPRMPQVLIGRPFQKLKLAHQDRLQPRKFLSSVLSERPAVNASANEGRFNVYPQEGRRLRRLATPHQCRFRPSGRRNSIPATTKQKQQDDDNQNNVHVSSGMSLPLLGRQPSSACNFRKLCDGDPEALNRFHDVS
jgi:hypothetical protein